MYDKDVTLSIVPNSYPVLEDKVPYALPIADQEKYTQQVYNTLSQADNSLEVIDFTETLKEHSDEYIYYPTIIGPRWVLIMPMWNIVRKKD